MNLLEENRCAELGAVVLMWLSVSHIGTHTYTHVSTHTYNAQFKFFKEVSGENAWHQFIQPKVPAPHCLPPKLKSCQYIGYMFEDKMESGWDAAACQLIQCIFKIIIIWSV